MQKINSAESIRGLACLAVVLSHLSLSFIPYLHHFDANDIANNQLIYAIHHSPFAFWYSGTAAVFIFFVLSGYVLSYAICKVPEQITFKLKNMWIKRYPRLMIPALISCLIIWLVFNTIQIDSSQVGGWLQAYVTQDFSLKTAVYEGTIGSFLFAESSINWVLWTMTIELLGSFTLFILIYLKQLHTAIFVLGSVAFAGLALWWRGEGFFYGISSFIIGMYFYFYGRQIPLFIAIILLIFGLYLAGAHNSSWSYAWLYAQIGERTYEYSNFFAGIFIVYSILMSQALSRFLDKPVLIWLGKLSFSVYLLHLVLMYLICIPVFNLLLNLGASYLFSVVLASLIFIAVTLFVAAFYSHYVDQLAMTSSQKLAKYLLKPKV
ncbi:acyltransferase [Acinetobacter sp. Marseille-Q1618]|uniref:acyltransferase family protein n=1 Tax=Acinetobacter sp. Marseille-Q1618 TaxID=2697502 RepID=UPI00156E5CF0|nr:acyltransferase [Acinetobacter sp. Marseille-Q1618]